MDIRGIDKESVWRIRHEVMWPDKELEYVQLKDDDIGRHYGLFEGDRLISVVSLFIDQEQAQFRKFATLEAEQGKGYGSRLLRHVMEEAERAGVKRIWCNARREKAAFYRKFGLQETETMFVKGGKEYVIMERF